MNIAILVGVKDRLQIYFVRTNELKANRSKEMIRKKTTQKKSAAALFFCCLNGAREALQRTGEPVTVFPLSVII